MNSVITNKPRWIHGRGFILKTAWILATVQLAAGTAMAVPTVLNFEDQPAGTTITTQYNASGVLFDRAFLSNASIFSAGTVARSGTRVIRSDNPINEFHSPPLVITFTSPQARVRMFAGSEVVPINAVLTAFDANNVVVGTDGPRQVAADVFTTEFQVSTAMPAITRVELKYDGVAFEAIDDLEFEGEPPAPPPLEAPVVSITSPADGVNLDVDVIEIEGIVTGEGLLSPVKLTVEFPRPPGTTAPPFTSELALLGTGTTREFSLPGGFNGVPMGLIKITIEAENSGGLRGTASVSFTNLPGPIRTRMQAELVAGAPPFGNFSFGIVTGACKIAVFDDGAISVDDADTTHVVRGDILAKWLSLRGPFDNAGFGCPLGEERDGPGDSRVQDFEDGRIFTNLDNGTAYVPNVFLGVIETREMEFLGDLEETVPLSDPVMPVIPVQEPKQTWLFQRFIRPDRPDLLPSTLEIQGTPPRLWIQRQSGINPARTATLWEDYPCSGNLGPCDVQPPQRNFPPIQNAGDLFCGGEALEDRKLDIITECIATDGTVCGGGEWMHIKEDNYVGTPIFGIVTDSAMAGEDLVWSHEWTYGALCYPGCPSDWTFDVIPIGPHRGVAPHQSIFAEGNPLSGVGPGNLRKIELEYERFYGEFVLWMGGFPQDGDLVFAVGRWIIDCGHDNFQAELHPIYMYSKMSTVTEIIDPFTGLPQQNPFGGAPVATRADVWVNGWYPGGNDPEDAIEFDIYPPPRPSPTATLVVNKPVDEDALIIANGPDGGVSIEYSIEPPFIANHVHIKFTAPMRRNFVDKWGEVKWEINRGYEGQWYVYWSE